MARSKKKAKKNTAKSQFTYTFWSLLLLADYETRNPQEIFKAPRGRFHVVRLEEARNRKVRFHLKTDRKFYSPPPHAPNVSFNS